MATVVREKSQLAVFHEVRWETYLALLADEEMQRGRMAYDEGTLEIMSPSMNHEIIKTTIGRLIETLGLELDLDIIGAGSTTLTRFDLKRSVEPDECYYFHDVQHARETGQLSLPDDPPPELVIEVDLSSSRIRQSIYAKLGIAESWRFAKNRLAMYRLQADGQYLEVERSVVLPQLTAADLTRFLALRETLNEAQIVRQFRDWIRENFGAK